jgi:hypothetical protein
MNHSYVDGCGGKGAVCLELGFHTAPRDYAAPSGACPVESALVQGGAKSRLSGAVYFDVDTPGGVCNVNRTPDACMCAETFTCACIMSNPIPYGLPICNSNNYTFQSCTVQANGVPLVTCQ